MLPDYEKMDNLDLLQAAHRLGSELRPHLVRVEENPSRFPEVRKIYDETYRSRAVEIARAANKKGSNADVSVIFADILNPTHLRKLIELFETLTLPNETKKAKA
jgi:hypothetical protein